MFQFQPRNFPPASGPWVSIAGAGPGDPELLTVKALDRIRSADGIVYDALISAEVRALFPPGAALFAMGKRAGDSASATQTEINRLLLECAREGMRVVRLKGGDPFIFGRGGEEALFLAAHGIPFEIIPAVSAINGAAAAAGIPLTHRGLSQSCTVLNGHEGHRDEIAWPSLVALGGTWVFLMAKHGAQPIARALLHHGAAPDLFLALVEEATLPTQAVRIVTLAQAGEGLCLPQTAGPGLLLVGPSVEFALELAAAANNLESYGNALPDFPEFGGEESLDCRGR